MKMYFTIFLGFFMVCISAQNGKTHLPQEKETTALQPTKNDESEYELTVLDPQYEYFLRAVASPKNQYTEAYLKNRNTFLVSEWNSYFSSGRYKDVIESRIDYNPREHYGLDFEYKLYQVFVYVQWRYKLRMSGLGGSDVGLF